jgi:hypothetical protein
MIFAYLGQLPYLDNGIIVIVNISDFSDLISLNRDGNLLIYLLIVDNEANTPDINTK